MSDNLMGTKAAANLLGVSVATVNRWAADEAGPLQAAVEVPGPAGGRPAARLFLRGDVEAYKALRELRRTKAVEHGACPRCTTGGCAEFHDPEDCPNTEAVAS
jgi:DNA-binding transcriptional regulator YdaS (Cro superfamily)